jgi:monoamine oxidase
VLGELNRLTAQVRLEAPWETAGAKELDEMTVEDWLGSVTKNQTVQSFLRVSTRALVTMNTYQMSFLYFLFYMRSGDNFDTLMAFENGAQAFLVKESMHQLAVRIGGGLGKAIVFEAAVRTIAQNEKGVRVETAKGEWQADYAVVAVPLPLSVRIAYEPALPAERDALAQHMPMGSVIKCWVAYEKPIWRERGLNGILWSDLPPSDGYCDASPVEGGPGFLVGFIEAHNALKWTGRSVEERKKAIVEQLVGFLGPEAANPIGYEDNDWTADPWSRGCYGASMGPGRTRQHPR